MEKKVLKVKFPLWLVITLIVPIVVGINVIRLL